MVRKEEFVMNPMWLQQIATQSQLKSLWVGKTASVKYNKHLVEIENPSRLDDGSEI